MTEPEQNQTARQASFQKPALYLGVALLAGFAAVAAFTARDRAQRSELEQVSEPTAVGDRSYFATGTALVVKGRTVAVEGPTNARDSEMFKVGADDSGAIMLYRRKPPAEPDALFVKAADNSYFKIAP